MLATFDDRQGSIFGLGELDTQVLAILDGNRPGPLFRAPTTDIDISRATIKTISSRRLIAQHSQSLAPSSPRSFSLQGLVKRPLIVRDRQGQSPQPKQCVQNASRGLPALINRIGKCITRRTVLIQIRSSNPEFGFADFHSPLRYRAISFLSFLCQHGHACGDPSTLHVPRRC